MISDKDKEIAELTALLTSSEKIHMEKSLKMADLHSVKSQNERL